ncbi:OpgC domain-containing protein [Ensifer canadensis]|uniref:OpgC domain-containing protein n=1 Tax=Ensifer canadensis TaxID=555315 RepID=UPI0035E3E9DF
MEKQRESRIDLLRGVALLLIFVSHSEFTFSGLVQHSRGFADASDMFVLLAGVRRSCLLPTLRVPTIQATVETRCHPLSRPHFAFFAVGWHFCRCEGS